MADFEQDSTEAAAEPKPRKPKAKKSGPSPVAALAVVVAIAAIALSAYLFMQVKELNETLSTKLPPVNGLDEGAEGDGTGGTELASLTEEHPVRFDLGQITGNSLDGKIVAISLELELESPYDQKAWEVYEHQLKNYDLQNQIYKEVQLGDRQIDGTEWPDGKKPEGEHAWNNNRGASTTHASVQAAPVELVPMEKPIEPSRPLTNLEGVLGKDENKLKDMIIRVINSFNGQDIITDNGFSASIQSILQNHIEVRFGQSQGKIISVTIYNKYVD